jgi:DNA (cytosine-5)-methyltransferase 1
MEEWVFHEGVIPKAFPVIDDFVEHKNSENGILSQSLENITEQFNKQGGKSPFLNSGIMFDYKYFTIDTKPKYNGKEKTLSDIIIKDDKMVAEEFFIDEKSLMSWNKLKGAKKETRISKEGFEYEYAEGSMVFPDALDKPSRTIITGEGGSSPSRFKHVITSPTSGRKRRLTPLELERLNMFPDNHTNLDNMSDVKRAFFMGNALVVGIVEKLGISLSQEITNKVQVKNAIK